jgi:LytS/YehU family sensor histidine kinase
MLYTGIGTKSQQALQMQRETSAQRARRHQAEFRYMNLKNQVNPHFLFNSLNVLDSIVQEGTREEASAYIHKMAAIYRYLMKLEGKQLVPLADELAFARNYRDLLLIRFSEGLITEDHIGENIPKGYIVPCTLQILLENIVKHNAIGPDNPLVAEISTDGKVVRVSNNIIPKQTAPSSSGIGLQYVRNQYRDIAGEEILIDSTETRFSVTVPILEEPE